MQRKTKHKKEVVERMRLIALTRDNTNRIKALPKGKKHWRWSEIPTIITLHKRIHRKFGKASLFKCNNCDKPARDWALIGKEYTDNKNDYRPMCRKCHIKFDNSCAKRDPDCYKRNRDEEGKFKRE